MQKGDKKGALEMSMGTIIILVLGVTMLIFGMILIRNIMCSGLEITEDLSQGVKNEVKNLFGANQYGIKCVGEGGQDVKLATGGQRKLICIIKSDTPTKYSLDVKSIESLAGASTTTVNKWAIKKGAQDVSIKPGGDGTEVNFLILDIPRDAEKTTVAITIEVTSEDLGAETIESIINIEPTGAIKSAIC